MFFTGVAGLYWLMSLPVPALKAGVLHTHMVGANPVIEVDFYRSMTAGQIGQFVEENDDLADILGVIKYMHLEVVPEHIESPSRTSRKNNISAIGRWRFKVKNPSDFLSSVEAISQDFGPFVTFDGGQNTNPAFDDVIKQYGEVVGIQQQIALSIATMQPYCWYSITGFCPNLPFQCTKGYPNCPDTSFDTERCRIEPEGCPGKGDISDPNEQCMEYAAGGVVEGGLCEGGANSDKDPAGSPDCTYTYKSPDQVSLDTLVGITEEDCGDRLCTDWHDFREHCTNRDFKQHFDAATGNLVNSATCVEYDIHPACQDGCDEPACVAALPREIGLPFWLGRCNATATMIRAEAVADAFSIAGATTEHQLLAEDLRPGAEAVQSCKWAGSSTLCNPNVDTGGTYCTRSWGSACTPCYIPGTVSVYPDTSHPLCPFHIIDSPDYQDLRPNCKDLVSPIGLCCLYLKNSCRGNSTGDGAALDFAGFLLVAAQKNTDEMAKFLFRLFNGTADSEQVVVDEARLHEAAYWQWQMDVTGKAWLNDPDATLSAINSTIAPCFAPASSPPTTPSPGPGPTTSPPTTAAPTTTTTAPEDEDPASWLPVIVVIILLILAGTIGVVWYRRKLKMEAVIANPEDTSLQRARS